MSNNNGTTSVAAVTASSWWWWLEEDDMVVVTVWCRGIDVWRWCHVRWRNTSVVVIAIFSTIYLSIYSDRIVDTQWMSRILSFCGLVLFIREELVFPFLPSDSKYLTWFWFDFEIKEIRCVVVFLCGLERFDGGEARESGVGSGVYDVVVPILWTLSCPSTD